MDAKREAEWIFEIPFQYAWVAAEALEEDLNPACASAVIESRLSSTCRVRIDFAVPGLEGRAVRVRVWRLRASCPFCDAGADQLLHGGNWIDVHEWDEDIEMDLLSGGNPRSGSFMGIKAMYEVDGIEESLNRQFFSKAIRSWGLRACSEAGPCVADGGAKEGEELSSDASNGAVNAYGVSLAAVRAALDEAGSVERASCAAAHDGQESGTIARECCIEGYFGGLYRCDHCGNVFAAVHLDHRDDTREGRYRLMPEIVEAIDGLVAKKGCIEAVESGALNVPEHVPTMSVRVSQSAGCIAVRANIAGRAYELAFDTADGSFLLDGDPCMMDAPVPHLQIHRLPSHPLIQDCLSAVPELMVGLLEMLPPLPEGVEATPAALQGHGYGINLLIAANRFVGYPAAFYREMALSGSTLSSTCGLDLTYPLKAGLPRDYARVGALYERAGLPEDERLKRSLMNRPQLLIDILRKPDMPFVSVDVLLRFFQLSRMDLCMRILSFYPKSAAGWRRLTEAKGEEAVFSYIEAQAQRANVLSSLPDDERFCEVSFFLDALCDHVTDEELANVRMDKLHDDLAALMMRKRDVVT